MSTSDNTKNTTKESNQVAPEANKKQSPQSQNSDLNGIYVGIAFVVLLWIFYPFLLNLADNSKPEQPQIIIPYQIDAMLKTEPEQSETIDEEKTKFQQIGDTYGTYGDSYGSLNTLFSGLAFTFLVASLFLQRKELHAQRLEIEDQKDEIRKSNIIAEGQRLITEQQANLIQDQINEAKKQNFYSLFFQFLNEKNRKVEALSIRSHTPDKSLEFGEIFFKIFSDDLKAALHLSIIPPPPPDNGPPLLKVELLIQQIYEKYEYIIHMRRASFEENLYFEYFVFILDFIEKNSNHIDRDVVINTFLSYLTHHETMCMAFYALIRNEKLKKFIECYGLLRKLNLELLNDEEVENLQLLFNDESFTTKKPNDLSFLFEEDFLPKEKQKGHDL
ncbi:hypothetical protein I0P11_07550 [Acinetobacter baumannii]|uniref:hypothetical protein n=1 Tax=Acinetobacter baumannii TaxID=470 RepID=UPI0018B00143|nr:hypothetical protein [Acinetobacter baumannii]MBF9260993.1 hypothetical protein [Acinetobacter baumannii]